MKKLTGIKLAVVSMVALGLLALFFLSLPASSKPEAMPGAELDHNVRLVYWQRERLSRAQKRADVEPTYTPYVWRLNVPEEFIGKRVGKTRPQSNMLTSVEHIKRAKDNHSTYVNLVGRINPNTSKIEAFDNSQQGQHLFFARLNDNARGRKVITQSCTPIRMSSFHLDPEYFQPDGCSPDTRGCDYSYEIDGWSIALRINRKLPKPAFAYCDPIRDWIDGMTVYRNPIEDDRRYVGDYNWKAVLGIGTEQVPGPVKPFPTETDDAP